MEWKEIATPFRGNKFSQSNYNLKFWNFFSSATLFLEGCQLNFSSPIKNCQMKAGPYKIYLTNPAKILQSPGPVSKMIKMTLLLKMKRSTVIVIKQKRKNR